MVKTVLGVVVVILVCARPALPAKEITRDQARQLVLKALEAETNFTRLPKFGLGAGADPAPWVYDFAKPRAVRCRAKRLLLAETQ